MLNRAWLILKKFVCVLLNYVHGKWKLATIWWKVSIERNFAEGWSLSLELLAISKSMSCLFSHYTLTVESISVTCVVGYLSGHVRVNQETSLIRPAPCHIPWSVPTSTQHQQWQAKLLGEVDTLSGRRWGSEHIQVTDSRSKPVLAYFQCSQYYTDPTFVQSSLT